MIKHEEKIIERKKAAILLMAFKEAESLLVSRGFLDLKKTHRQKTRLEEGEFDAILKRIKIKQNEQK